jgi:hypothetical protein
MIVSAYFSYYSLSRFVYAAPHPSWTMYIAHIVFSSILLGAQLVTAILSCRKCHRDVYRHNVESFHLALAVDFISLAEAIIHLASLRISIAATPEEDPKLGRTKKFAGVGVGLGGASIVSSTLSMGEFLMRPSLIVPGAAHSGRWGFCARTLLLPGFVPRGNGYRQAKAVWGWLGVVLKWTFNRFVDGFRLVVDGIVASLKWIWWLFTTLGGWFCVASKWVFHGFADVFRAAMEWILNDDVAPAEEVGERDEGLEEYLLKILTAIRHHHVAFSGL